jgi:hypothetical protein
MADHWTADRRAEQAFNSQLEAQPMPADEKSATMLHPARHPLSPSRASLPSLYGRVRMMLFAALHESRAREAARVIQLYRDLVADSQELAQMSGGAAAKSGRQSRGVEKSP